MRAWQPAGASRGTVLALRDEGPSATLLWNREDLVNRGIATQTAGERAYATATVIATERAKHNVAHHYDIDGSIYDLFLDADRQYSCGYFRSPKDSLETAQRAKKRHLGDQPDHWAGLNRSHCSSVVVGTARYTRDQRLRFKFGIWVG